MYCLNKNNNYHVIALAITATILTLAIIFSSSMITIPVQASPIDGNNTTTSASTTTTPSSSGLELSAQPVWDEQVTSTGVTPINETHSVGTFIGNGTMTVPDTGETVNMTNNGTAIISPVPGYTDTVSASGREYVFSEDDDDDDISAITFYEIIRYNPETFEGNGLVIAVFDNNATGSLAPFNGMMVVGTHEEDPSTRTATIRLWEWESGIPIPPAATGMEESPASPMNTATDAIDSNRTEATEGEQGQEQQTTPSIAPTPLLE
jgi:hypothetical protein